MGAKGKKKGENVGDGRQDPEGGAARMGDLGSRVERIDFKEEARKDAERGENAEKIGGPAKLRRRRSRRRVTGGEGPVGGKGEMTSPVHLTRTISIVQF